MKNKTETILRTNKKNFQDEEFPHELFLNVNRYKTQLSKMTQSGGFVDKIVGNLGKRALLDLSVLLANNVLPQLANKATLSILDNFERKISGKRAVRVGKGFTLFILNEDCGWYYYNNKVVRRFKSINWRYY